MGKKIIIALSAATLLGATLYGAGLANASSKAIQAKTDGASSIVFDFEGENPFEGWSISDNEKSLTDLLNDSNTFFWNDSHHFYGNGDKFLDMYKTTETWTGTITSPSFTLGGEGYISALIGGGNNSTSYIDVVDSEDSGKSYGRLTNLHFLDASETSRAECLAFNFIQLPDCIGKSLKLVIRQTDGTQGLKGITVDDIAIGLTKTELKARFNVEKDRFSGDFTDKCGLGLKELYTRIASDFESGDDSIINPGFESGTALGWTVSSETRPNLYTSVSNAETYWGENIPTNKTGTYYWDGWYENTGLEEKESYSLRSTTFTLSGKGYISYSIAGKSSAVEVRRVSDGATLAHFDNNAYNVGTFPYVADGLGDSRQGTLTHVVADLTGYVGEKLYLVFMDQSQESNDWGLLFFDDIKTNYDETPDINALSDAITNPTLGSGNNNYNADYDGASGVIKYRTASHSNDDQKKASEFMSYFKSLRKEGSICWVKSDSDELNKLKANYDGLTDGAKAIVNASHDYGLNKNDGTGVYAECTVPETLAMLGITKATVNEVKGLLHNSVSSSEGSALIVTAGAALLAVGSFVFFLKQRKHKKED